MSYSLRFFTSVGLCPFFSAVAGDTLEQMFMSAPVSRSCCCGLLALLLSVCVPETGCCTAEPLPKGAWSEPVGGYSVDSFSLGAGETHRGGWGGYSPNERRYFDEFLPALFERTLVVNAPSIKRGFRWIFTGERASLTIDHNGPTNVLYLGITYYDSPAFDVPNTEGRNPQREVKTACFILPDSEAPRALTVRLDQKQTLVVLADGTPVLTTRWAHSFSRHQVQLTKGTNAVAFRLLTPQPRKVNVTVDSAKTHQTMLGWGVSARRPPTGNSAKQVVVSGGAGSPNTTCCFNGSILPERCCMKPWITGIS